MHIDRFYDSQDDFWKMTAGSNNPEDFMAPFRRGDHLFKPATSLMGNVLQNVFRGKLNCSYFEYQNKNVPSKSPGRKGIFICPPFPPKKMGKKYVEMM